MRDEIAAQHRRLAALFSALRHALEGGREAVDELAELRGALAVHFEQEDRLYYPTVGSLRPEHRTSVYRFASDHERFLAALEGVAERIRQRALAEAAREFEQFAEEFARHEAREEGLLGALHAETEAAR